MIQRWLEQGDHSLKLWSNRTPGKTCVLIYRTDQEPSLIRSENIRPVVPGQTVLYNNYPNPFNAGTIISFELEKTQEVNLSIYNTLGQKVNTVFNGCLESGRHNLRWSGDDNSGRRVNSGVYYCQLQTGSSLITKKMILLQ